MPAICCLCFCSARDCVHSECHIRSDVCCNEAQCSFAMMQDGITYTAARKASITLRQSHLPDVTLDPHRGHSCVTAFTQPEQGYFQVAVIRKSRVHSLTLEHSRDPKCMLEYWLSLPDSTSIEPKGPDAAALSPGGKSRSNNFVQMPSDPDSRGASRWKREAMPALRRTEGASGSQRASDAQRSAPQQAPERAAAWERPGRFRGDRRTWDVLWR